MAAAEQNMGLNPKPSYIPQQTPQSPSPYFVLSSPEFGSVKIITDHPNQPSQKRKTIRTDFDLPETIEDDQNSTIRPKKIDFGTKAPSQSSNKKAKPNRNFRTIDDFDNENYGLSNLISTVDRKLASLPIPAFDNFTRVEKCDHEKLDDLLNLKEKLKKMISIQMALIMKSMH